MVEEAIESLMRAILTLRLPDGKTRRVQFLGGNDLDDPDRPAGVLTYSFDKRLIDVLKDSTIWGKIALPVLMAFTSKYAVSLYENLAQCVNLSMKQHQEYTLDEFRELLGVPPGRYKAFGELNKHVIKPAVDEVNALAPFSVSVGPMKQGKKVVKVTRPLDAEGQPGAGGGHGRDAALQGRPPRPHHRDGGARHRAAAVAQSPDPQPAEASRFPENLIVGSPVCAAARGRAGGFSPPSPKTSFYRPENLTVSPGFLTVEGHFPPNTSSESPTPSHLSRQRSVIKQ